MKKILLALAVVGFSASFANAQEVKENPKLKADIAKCIDKVKEQMGDLGDKEDAVKNYCTCQTEGLMKALTEDEYNNLEKYMQDPEKQSALQEKLMPVIMPCLEELQKVMQ